MSVRQLGAPEDLETPRPLPARSPVPKRITGVAATADLSRAAVATVAPWFREFAEVLLLAEGAVVRLAAPGRRRILDLVFDPDGSALTAMDSGNSILRWTFDAPGEPWTHPVPGSGGADLDLAQAAVGSRFFATSNAFSRNVVVWDVGTRRVVHDIEKIFKGRAFEDRVEGEGTVALSADESRLAFSRAQAYRWSSKNEVVVHEIGSDTYTEYRTGIPWVNGLAFGPDGAALAVVGARPDETVATVVDLNDPADEPEPVVLPTGERVGRINLRPVWCGGEPRVPIVDQNRVAVWNLATASAVLSVEAPGPRIATALTSDGRTLVIASPDDGVHAHSLP